MGFIQNMNELYLSLDKLLLLHDSLGTISLTDEQLADIANIQNNIDVVTSVNNNNADITAVAQNLTDIINASKIINMTVATGATGTSVSWDANTSVLTVPIGATGATGNSGQDGNDGINGLDVDHVSKTDGTGGSGTTDTYTLWQDSDETVSLGTFEVYNGADGDGAGDMLKDTYDTSDSGVVDNSEKVNGLTVETAVPENAVFTDTVTSLVDDLDSSSTSEALTANQGLVLKGLVSSSVDFKKPNTNVLFTKTNPADFTIPVGFKVTVGTTAVEITEEQTLSLNTNLDTGTKTAGTDYYVYVKDDSTFYISTDKTITTDRLIGGFHYCLTAEDEAKTGNKTDDDMVDIRGINKFSFWDLKFKSIAGNDGMALIGTKWYDIYFTNSEHITNGTSKAGAIIAGGTTDNGRAIPKIPLEYGGDGSTNYGKFTWFQACEIAKSHGKEPADYAEFPTIAYGVDEGKSSDTDNYETTTGKIEHYSHLTSKFGIEQATGVQWIWGKDVGGNRDEGSTSWDWRDKADSRGQIYSLHDNHITAVLLGGYRGDGVHAGSRASHWNYYVWYSYWSIGVRLSCAHLELV